MQTLKRELRLKIKEVLHGFTFAHEIAEHECERLVSELVDTVSSVRAFKTDEERPVYGLDWALGHGLDVDSQDLSAARVADEAPKKFEAAFGFDGLPWDSTDVWRKMQKFVTNIYVEDRLAFGNYLVWRKSKEGKYIAMSNKQIRMNPQVFMDTGWFEFVNRNNEAQEPDIFAEYAKEHGYDNS